MKCRIVIETFIHGHNKGGVCLERNDLTVVIIENNVFSEEDFEHLYNSLNDQLDDFKLEQDRVYRFDVERMYDNELDPMAYWFNITNPELMAEPEF